MSIDENLPAIIPRPIQLELQPDHFTIDSHTAIVTDEANHGNAVYLRRLVSPAFRRATV